MFISRLGAGAALALIGAGVAPAQVITGVDARETARFAVVTKTVGAAGFISPAMVAHGDSTFGKWFLLYATQRDTGVLIAAIEPGKHPLVLEWAKTPADIGFNGVSLAPFLGMPGLFDVEVSHRPFMLETSRTYSTHHIVRQAGDSLEFVCDLPGSSRASASKGVGSRTTVQTVTFAIAPNNPWGFNMTTVEATTSQGAEDVAATEHVTRVRRFSIRASPDGRCIEMLTGQLGR